MVWWRRWLWVQEQVSVRLAPHGHSWTIGSVLEGYQVFGAVQRLEWWGTDELSHTDLKLSHRVTVCVTRFLARLGGALPRSP